MKHWYQGAEIYCRYPIKGLDDLTPEEKRELYRKKNRIKIRFRSKKWYRTRNVVLREKRLLYYYINRDAINAKKRKNPISRLKKETIRKNNALVKRRIKKLLLLARNRVYYYGKTNQPDKLQAEIKNIKRLQQYYTPTGKSRIEKRTQREAEKELFKIQEAKAKSDA